MKPIFSGFTMLLLGFVVTATGCDSGSGSGGRSDPNSDTFESGAAISWSLGGYNGTHVEVVAEAAHGGNYGLQVGPSDCGIFCTFDERMVITKALKPPKKGGRVKAWMRHRSGSGSPQVWIFVNNPQPTGYGTIGTDTFSPESLTSDWSEYTFDTTETMDTITIVVTGISDQDLIDLDDVEITGTNDTQAYSNVGDITIEGNIYVMDFDDCYGQNIRFNVTYLGFDLDDLWIWVENRSIPFVSSSSGGGYYYLDVWNEEEIGLRAGGKVSVEILSVMGTETVDHPIWGSLTFRFPPFSESFVIPDYHGTPDLSIETTYPLSERGYLYNLDSEIEVSSANTYE